jgi:hypothetical protein
VSFFCVPATAVRAGIDDSPDPGCPTAAGVPQNTGHAIAFTGSLSCFRPGGERFGTALSQPPDHQRANLPVPGTPCRDVFFRPVTFHDVGGDVRASFTLSDGSGAADRFMSPSDQAMAATNDAMVAEAQDGTFQLANPTDPTSLLSCQLDPRFRSFCPNAPTLTDRTCFIWQQHLITPDTSPPADWGPFVAAIAGSIGGEAGTIGSAPSERGVVNTPTCFWIDGMGIPVERDLMLILPGGADSSGRSIFFTYLVRIRFDHVEWTFDDPVDNTPSAPSADCGSHPQLSAHSYRQISDDRHDDHRYHVTARELYTITVDQFFIDSFGTHHAQVPPRASEPVITPTPLSQYVGQVEGIPVNP